MWWSTVSNAALRSKRTRSESSLLSTARTMSLSCLYTMSLCTDSTAVSVHGMKLTICGLLRWKQVEHGRMRYKSSYVARSYVQAVTNSQSCKVTSTGTRLILLENTGLLIHNNYNNFRFLVNRPLFLELLQRKRGPKSKLLGTAWTGLFCRQRQSSECQR